MNPLAIPLAASPDEGWVLCVDDLGLIDSREIGVLDAVTVSGMGEYDFREPIINLAAWGFEVDDC